MAKNEAIGFTVTKTESGDVQILDIFTSNVIVLYPWEVAALHHELVKFLDLDKPVTPSNPPPDQL